MTSNRPDFVQISKMSHKAQVQYFERRMLGGMTSDIAYAPENVKKDLSLAFKVAAKEPLMLSYFDKSLGCNEELIMSAISHITKYEDTPLFKNFIKYMDGSLKNSKEFVLAVVAKNASFLQPLLVPLMKHVSGGKLADCKSFMLDALRLNASQGLKVSSIISFLSTLNTKNDSISKDLDFVDQCIDVEPLSYTCFSMDVKSNLDFATKALKKGKTVAFNILMAAPHVILKDDTFIKVAIDTNITTSINYYLVMCDKTELFHQNFLKSLSDIKGEEHIVRLLNSLSQGKFSDEDNFKKGVLLAFDILSSKASGKALKSINIKDGWFGDLIKDEIHKKGIKDILLKPVTENIKKRKTLKKTP